MTTFKHGDYVTCTIDGINITDARISIDNAGNPFICQDIKDGYDADDKLGYKYSWCIEKDFTCYGVTNLKLKTMTLDDIKEGDVIYNAAGNERTVLVRMNQVVILGRKENYGIFAIPTYTIDELKYKGYTLKNTTEPVKMTVAEIAAKLGHEVEVIKG